MAVESNRRSNMTGQNSIDNREGSREDATTRLSSYDKLTHDLSTSDKLKQEVALGKRIGFYRIRGELGTGNFCQVKMGIHALARGRYIRFCQVLITVSFRTIETVTPRCQFEI